MESSLFISKKDTYVVLVSVAFILFWFFAAGSKLYDFGEWKQEMDNQVFSRRITYGIIYTLPALEIMIAALLVRSATRLIGMILTFGLMVIFTIYVGLALLEVYSRTPCNCAGLMGQNSSWAANFKLNLLITAVAGAGLILTSKSKERRKKGMDTVVSHAPLTT
ncbi:MAG: MauE/DoxX family redox-associated membrane protein [Mucilaginibacter sp.]|uniref:MauE/DoxX family redox-associated membrane protein n=1 Tax=Mucilaginibacter sp. TaxID=1882438 RepID=UPI003265DE73